MSACGAEGSPFCAMLRAKSELEFDRREDGHKYIIKGKRKDTKAWVCGNGQ